MMTDEVINGKLRVGSEDFNEYTLEDLDRIIGDLEATLKLWKDRREKLLE